eukprot:m.50096 g.50096  ORF g.50096 m.50096 type:complete len:50 (-) comp13391_c0_seq6:971-1120(-)
MLMDVLSILSSLRLEAEQTAVEAAEDEMTAIFSIVEVGKHDYWDIRCFA